jgi:hypothetical protein
MSTNSPLRLALHFGQSPRAGEPFGFLQNIPDQPPPCFVITKVFDAMDGEENEHAKMKL